MDVEVRFVEARPNVLVTLQRLRVALDAVGRGDINIGLREVHTDAEAAELGSAGSPTIVINGSDRFAHSHALAGRSYRLCDSTVGVYGSPSIERLTAALAGAEQDPGRNG